MYGIYRTATAAHRLSKANFLYNTKPPTTFLPSYSAYKLYDVEWLGGGRPYLHIGIYCLIMPFSQRSLNADIRQIKRYPLLMQMALSLKWRKTGC